MTAEIAQALLGREGLAWALRCPAPADLKRGEFWSWAWGGASSVGPRLASDRLAGQAKCSWTLPLRIDERVVQDSLDVLSSPIVKVASETASWLTCRSWRTLENSPHLP